MTYTFSVFIFQFMIKKTAGVLLIVSPSQAVPMGLGRPSNIKPRSRVVARGSGRISVQEQSTIRATWEGNIFTTKDLDF